MRARGQFRTEATRILLKQRELLRRYRRLQEEAERRQVGAALEPLFSVVRTNFGEETEGLDRYLKSALHELLEHLSLFRATEESGGDAPPPLKAFLAYLEVNLITDLGQSDDPVMSCPVVEENHPTFRNLFGTIEGNEDGAPPDFSDLRAGSLLAANGGYLLLMAKDVLSEPGVYETLSAP